MSALSFSSIRWATGIGTGKSAALRGELQKRMALGRRPVRFVSATSDVGLRTERVNGEDDRIVSALELEPLQGRLVRTLSSGERQRVRLADALAQGAQDIAMDEPARHLDPHFLESVAGILRARRSEGTSLLVAETRRSLPTSLFDRDPSSTEPLPKHNLTNSLQPSDPLLVTIPTCFLPEAPKKREVQTLSIPTGALTCVRGFNGAGKTSLLRTVHNAARKHGFKSGLSRQDLEQQVFAPTPRKEVEDVLRSFPPAPWLRDALGTHQSDPIDSLATWVGLRPWLDTPMCALPLGALALLGVTVALLVGQNLVLLDEPTQGLDEKTAQRVAGVLSQSAHFGACILAATHDPKLTHAASTSWLVHDGVLTMDRESEEGWKAA